jgi:hypothetical protein
VKSTNFVPSPQSEGANYTIDKTDKGLPEYFFSKNFKPDIKEWKRQALYVLVSFEYIDK